MLADGSYTFPQVVDITVIFSENVTVAGPSPRITLETGATDKTAIYSSGSGTQILIFYYTVASGDTSSDLEYWNSAALDLAGSTITDIANNNANPLLPGIGGGADSLSDNKAIVIDTTQPTVVDVNSPNSNGPYGVGDAIDILVTLSENVNVNTGSGTPSITLNIFSPQSPVMAYYFSGSGGNTLLFRYTIDIRDSSADLDYSSINAFVLNGGNIKDPATNNLIQILPTPGAASSLGFNKNIAIHRGRWSPMSSTGAPSGRNEITAAVVASGSKVVFWGGYSGSALNNGAIYDVAANSWTTMTATNAPSPRSGHGMVLAGSQVAVWGGYGSGYIDNGGFYNIASDSWTDLPNFYTNNPTPRYLPALAWVGGRLLVWGGTNGSALNNGAIFDPIMTSWSNISPTFAPYPRQYFSSVSTGSKLLVWGGYYSLYSNGRNDGGVYDIATNGWSPITLTNAPGEKSGARAVWTGSHMLVWGGKDTSGVTVNTGGLFNLQANTWSETSSTNAPSARIDHHIVWNSKYATIWGGDQSSGSYINSGASFNPSLNIWSPLNPINAPSARMRGGMALAGSRILMWGGSNGGSLSDGAVFETGEAQPDDSWDLMMTTSAPSIRYQHAAVWTGSKMIIWGGSNGGSTNTGNIYDLISNSWGVVTTTNALPPRAGATGVWTGSKMIIWGNNSTNYNTGAIYDPIANSWSTMSTSGPGAPSARRNASVIYSGVPGKELIVWGGFAGTYVNSGAVYDIAGNSWTATSTLSGAPSTRQYHTVVYTGQGMLVWGGTNGSYTNTGASLMIASLSWAPISTTNAPSPRGQISSVWTGSKMLVWGGNSGSPLNNGGQYNPSTDSWSSIVYATNTPSARYSHTSIWTGSKMIVFGGTNGGMAFNDGASYDPGSDSWTTISAGPFAPSARYGHSAVWTGYIGDSQSEARYNLNSSGDTGKMIIFGGYDGTTYMNSGGIYQPAP
jgi:hypothetical protein